MMPLQLVMEIVITASHAAGGYPRMCVSLCVFRWSVSDCVVCFLSCASVLGVGGCPSGVAEQKYCVGQIPVGRMGSGHQSMVGAGHGEATLGGNPMYASKIGFGR
jgi:hypothetical protein